jgi:glycine cleavage system H protein
MSVAVVRGCTFPEDLLYDVARHVWYAEAEGGLVRAGITPVGVALAREVLIFTPKRVGRPVEKGRAMATVESAKWVGSVRASFAARVEAVNAALAKGAGAVNRDCYGEGWMLLLRPDAPDWREGLVTGAAVGPAYEAWMEREGFDGCGAPSE